MILLLDELLDNKSVGYMKTSSVQTWDRTTMQIRQTMDQEQVYSKNRISRVPKILNQRQDTTRRSKNMGSNGIQFHPSRREAAIESSLVHSIKIHFF
jgi:hypothetical protein